MPLIGTRGAASAQGFGEFAQSGPATYIEDVFSTYLYTGNGSTQTITNGIDLSTKGGLVWAKGRSAARSPILFDTARGVGNRIYSDSTLAQSNEPLSLTSFNTNGYSISSDSDMNLNGSTFVSWTFRKQPKFFDVVTWTGNGSNPRTISHNLGSTPGCIIVKETNASGSWAVWHRSLGDGYRLILNTTSASLNTSAADWFGTSNSTITSTGFTVGNNLNTNGRTLVAYLFAHNAGGFGLSGADNVISCGAYTGTSATQQISLGFEPQWILVKDRNQALTDWIIIDNMRGMSTSSAGANVDKALRANSSVAEYDSSDFGATATGFIPGGDVNNNGNSYIYIAIRRGPMKTPTSGTSVLALNTRTGNSSTSTVSNLSFPPDLVWTDTRSNAEGAYMFDKLRGTLRGLRNFGPDAEVNDPQYLQIFGQTGFTYGSNGSINASARTYIDWCMRRAPSFFDEVCYTGTGSATTQAHNLNAVPELMIVKNRTSTAGYDWFVYHSALGNTKVVVLNTTAAAGTSASAWNSTTPTSTVFSVGSAGNTNRSGDSMVAYLFASCPGVSKVGSYSGTGGTQTISCGFAVRYVLIKRTDSTGNWWVWDTARGMVAGTDPRLPINDALGETNANWVYTDASGFQIVTTDASVNASGGTYIYLAIA